MSSEETTLEAPTDPAEAEEWDDFEEENLPEALPVLPLRNTVLFPTVVTRTPMIATTERAKQLIADVLEGDRLLVVVAARDADVSEPGPDDLHDVGTVVRIVKSAPGEDDSQRLWVQGLRRARIQKYLTAGKSRGKRGLLRCHSGSSPLDSSPRPERPRRPRRGQRWVSRAPTVAQWS